MAQLTQNIHVYFLAFVSYWGILLFGYDTGIAGGVISQKAFVNAFMAGASKSHITAVSSNVVAVLQGGAFFGALGSAYFSSKIGRRYTLLLFCIIFIVGAILQTAANAGSSGLSMIYAGRVIAGVGIGAISAVAPTYVSECSPKEVRGRITGLFQIFVATGVMLSYFVNYGVSKHIHEGPRVWRIPFGLQLLPGGIMAFGLIFTKESPRWLARAGHSERALQNLAFLRRRSPEDQTVQDEYAEIEATVFEEQNARAGLTWKEAFFGPGNFIRFVIAFMIFLLQQFSGQNSVGYYAPQIFASIGYTGTSPALLASGVYGIVKVIATSIFIAFFIDSFGRRASLLGSGLGMGTLFFIVGALLKCYPPNPTGTVQAASKAMAAMLYLYCVCYSFGWGPTPWVYVSDIFPNRTRHYGLSVAAATQWLFNFVLSKITLTMVNNLGYKLFFTFATINILGMAVFAFFLPETKGRSLEEMDIIFGSVNAEDRSADIRKAHNAMHHEHESPDRGSDDLKEDIEQHEKPRQQV